MQNAIERNRSQRLAFVKYWADYVRTHDDKDWSSQQAVLIDSMLKSADQDAAKQRLVRSVA